MTSQLNCPLKFWIETNQELTAIGDALVDAQIIDSYHFDYENVYEWLACRPTKSLHELNVSRKHNHRGTPDPKLGFMLISNNKSQPLKSEVEELAMLVHQSLNQTVFIGLIDYIKGDEFEYTTLETLDASSKLGG